MLRGPSPDLALDDAATSIGYLSVVGLAAFGLGPRSWRHAAVGTFVIVAAVTAYALVGRLAPSLSLVTDGERALGTERLFSPLGYWNALGAWGAVALSMALALSADMRGAGWRAASLTVFPIASAVVYLTYSRGAVIASLVSVALVLVLTRNQRRAVSHLFIATVSSAFLILAIRSQPAIADGTGTGGGVTVLACAILAAGACAVFATGAISRAQRTRGAAELSKRSIAALAAIGLFMAAVFVVVFVSSDSRLSRGGETISVRPSDPSTRLLTTSGGRGDLWGEALHGFEASPIAGEGSGSFAYRWAKGADHGDLVRDAHSLPIEIAAELGLLGLGALGLLLYGLGSAAIAGLNSARRSGAAVGLAAAFVVFLSSSLIDWTWDCAPLALVGLGSAGVLAMAASRTPTSRRARLVKPVSRRASVGLAVALGAVQVPGAISAQLIESSAVQLRLGDGADALADANKALTAAPWSGRAEAAKARAQFYLADFDAARSSALDAIHDEPEEQSHQLLLAEIEAARMDFEAAASALRNAVVLSPTDPHLMRPDVAELVATLDSAGFPLEEILAGSTGE